MLSRLLIRSYASWAPVRRSKLQVGQIIKMEDKIFSLDSSKPILGGTGVTLSGRQLGNDFSPIVSGKKIDIPTRTGGNFMDCIFKVWQK